VPTLATGAWQGWRWAVAREPEPDGEYCGVELEHADGRRRGCGFGGPVVWPGSPVNGYVGTEDGQPVVVLARSRELGDLGLLVDEEVVPPLWTGRVDGVSYLLHLLDPGRRGVIELTGTAGTDPVREWLRAPW
jgi:hypothetical protein